MADLNQSLSADAINHLPTLLRMMPETSDPVRRAPSTKSSRGRKSNMNYPVYPDQSFAALQRPNLPLRTRSSNAAQEETAKRSPLQAAITADNTPISSPGLFSFNNPKSHADNSAPQLHHLQKPKETHTAEIEHDTFSGNKFINNYEIVTELGRGEFGKVKLARDVETSALVAVKIVPRYSRNRRLGKLGAPEDQTKREVAILKRARHPNVVSLLEVIDDPNKNKVYLILEYVEHGEIIWRKPGVREVINVARGRYEQEKAGNPIPITVDEKDLFHTTQAQRRHEALERVRQTNSSVPNWSLEYGGDEDGFSDLSRSISTNSHQDFTDHAGRGRAASVAMSAVSHMSSEADFDESDENFVPTLTIEDIRRTICDTLAGLEFLHYIGIIHRDIKPSNLLITSNGSTKISDFGVSYLGKATTDEHVENTATEGKKELDDAELARTVGTPAFWAPELCYTDTTMFHNGQPPKIGPPLDLWALGVSLYCMVYARLPFALLGGGVNASVLAKEPFFPKTRLVPVASARKDNQHRSDYELRFEQVSEDLLDLLPRLLIKDPHRRITIAEAKQHPWILAGISDPSLWLRTPDRGKEVQKEIDHIDEKEITHAVVKRNIIERALTTAGRIAGSLLGRRGDNRKRASSSTTSTSRSTESIPSTVVKSDELVTALKTSRETEHPLAQSQTASPESEPEPTSYFPTERPNLPDRSISTADSVKTIRASGQKWEGTLARLASDDRIRGEPSLALSTASATGSIQTPNILQSDTAFKEAQDINQRRLIQESQQHHEITPDPKPSECPPSPDDMIFLRNNSFQAAPSASTIASNFSVSQSTSDPSFGMRSSASSPPQDTFLPVATTFRGKALEQQVDIYNDDDDENDDSEDDGIVMGGPKKL